MSRLIYLADVAEGYETSALRVTLAALLQGGDTRLYEAVCKRLGAEVDTAWVSQAEKDAIQLKEKLDADLNAAKTSLMKVSSPHAEARDAWRNIIFFFFCFSLISPFFLDRTRSGLAIRSSEICTTIATTSTRPSNVTCARATTARRPSTFSTCA